MEPTRFTFGKKNRLCSVKKISLLFSRKGDIQSFFQHPFIVNYIVEKDVEIGKAAILFSIPKKKIRRAVDRNRMKRLCKESFRLNGQAILDQSKKNHINLSILVLYVGTTVDVYPNVNKSISTIISKINHKLFPHEMDQVVAN